MVAARFKFVIGSDREGRIPEAADFGIYFFFEHFSHGKCSRAKQPGTTLLYLPGPRALKLGPGLFLL